MRDFVIKIRKLADGLVASEETMKDRDIIDFVAEGLGLNFRPFVSSIHSQPNMLFEILLALVVKEDDYLKR